MISGTPTPYLLPSGARWALWGVAVALVAWWTLLPFRQDLAAAALARAVADIQWVPFVERGRRPLWSDVLGNLALFLPFGLAGWACLRGRSRRLAAILTGAAVLSLTVELLQLTLPARRTSATDVATDVLGAGLGAALGRLWELGGQRAASRWFEAARRGEPAPAAAALFAVALVVWALLPGTSGGSEVWGQVQRFSASFRRFPGWSPWLAASSHHLFLGAAFGFLAGRSWEARGGRQGLAGGAAAAVLGLALEGLQLLGVGRRPDVFQAVAFALGGILGAAGAAFPNRAALLVPTLVLAAGLGWPPGADAPPGETWAALLLGGGLGFFAVLVAPPSRPLESSPPPGGP